MDGNYLKRVSTLLPQNTKLIFQLELRIINLSYSIFT